MSSIRTGERPAGFHTACIPWWVRSDRRRYRRRPARRCWHGNQSASSAWPRVAARRGVMAEHQLQRITERCDHAERRQTRSTTAYLSNRLCGKKELLWYDIGDAWRRRQPALASSHTYYYYYYYTTTLDFVYSACFSWSGFKLDIASAPQFSQRKLPKFFEAWSSEAKCLSCRPITVSKCWCYFN